ncbi:elongation factor P maturation arginine rhamnosyltransferase EarP [Massilia sp. Leaf139]|uniref:elongation factor P maturation arginine rhamnosyltransferase EarP n=1 Tax=Massilia sp. Leaf139 TaxID=1736272 RepID=UPI0006FC7C57|nr:elongation factor P maturation arginine rhamnosyltransferase EarP [Massilia sp. Leaf139]KQQ97619.1 epf adjacent protein [Massilia sp. Leaf139]
MSTSPSACSTPSLAIFCKVIDNYGDIGICWRLARQLHIEHGVAVTLWVDDLVSFRRICPEVDPAASIQQVAGVAVRHWRGQDDDYTPDEVADIVIEFFACDIPPRYIEAMAARTPKPVWLNLEGLTAEEWVEGCHALPSMHPRLKLTKHFFFPGFTEKTGGLLREAGLERERRAFLADPQGTRTFLRALGLTDGELDALKVSLFCYPHAPVAELFAAWQGGASKVACLVPEGVASEAVAAFLGTGARAGAVATRGALTVRVLPFVPQPHYDRLLWACDLNFVRGEDSWVRAQWAGKPFVWHIYPQDENLHHKKLRAFLARYAPEIASLQALMLEWNGAGTGPADWPALWAALLADQAQIERRSEEWQDAMSRNGDLASNLLRFAASLR